MRIARVSRALGLAAILLLSAACIIPIMFDPESGTWTAPSLQFQKTISLAPGGTLSLENGNGDVEIRGWDQEEVEITAEEERGGFRGRRGWFYPGTRDEKPQVNVDQFDKLIKIKAGSTDEENARPIHFVLNVPHSINLNDIRVRRGQIHIADVFGSARLDLEEGNITVENFSGSLDMSLVRGSAEAEVLDLRKDDEIRITTKEGDITLSLQPDVNVRLEATASNGSIASEFDLGQKLPAKKISAQIGQPEAAASLTTLNGDIHLKKVKSP
jgi:Toastrack DUF4097